MKLSASEKRARELERRAKRESDQGFPVVAQRLRAEARKLRQRAARRARYGSAKKIYHCRPDAHEPGCRASRPLCRHRRKTCKCAAAPWPHRPGSMRGCVSGGHGTREEIPEAILRSPSWRKASGMFRRAGRRLRAGLRSGAFHVKTLARTYVGKLSVRTDVTEDAGPETMVFEKGRDGRERVVSRYTRRYRSDAEALKGHNEIVARLRRPWWRGR